MTVLTPELLADLSADAASALDAKCPSSIAPDDLAALVTAAGLLRLALVGAAADAWEPKARQLLGIPVPPELPSWDMAPSWARFILRDLDRPESLAWAADFKDGPRGTLQAWSTGPDFFDLDTARWEVVGTIPAVAQPEAPTIVGAVRRVSVPINLADRLTARIDLSGNFCARCGVDHRALAELRELTK